ncbi:hypothetical protein [Timonella senegalensis]|uniref:hypothetical protein n=1 Tax=Timonella senegalensis TaxID=1465825 RepID=UPI0028AA3A7C|nr:hypothetical protein [Timonella senegalensis]
MNIALPVLAVSMFSTQSADLFTLGLGLYTVCSSILTWVVETSMLAEFGRLQLRRELGRRSLRSGVRLLLSRGWWIIALVCCVSALIYASSARNFDAAEKAPVFGLFLLAVIASSFSAVTSGYLYARGSYILALSTSGLRSLPALLGLFLSTSLLNVAALFAAGEALRVIVLYSACTRNGDNEGQPAQITTKTLLYQSVTAMFAQGGSLVSRAFLAAAPLGSIASGEIAFRVQSASSQVVNSVVLLPALTAIPSDLTGSGSTRSKLWGPYRVSLGALGLTILAIGAIFGIDSLLNHYGVTDFSTAATWSFYLLIALPLMMVSSWVSRALIYIGEENLLPFISGSSLIVTIIAITLLSSHGVVGVLLGSSVAQLWNALIYIITFIHVQRKKIAKTNRRHANI